MLYLGVWADRRDDARRPWGRRDQDRVAQPSRRGALRGQRGGHSQPDARRTLGAFRGGQPQQALAGARSQDGAGAGDFPPADRGNRCVHRELPARRAGTAGSGLRGAGADQPGVNPRRDRGLRLQRRGGAFARARRGGPGAGRLHVFDGRAGRSAQLEHAGHRRRDGRDLSGLRRAGRDRGAGTQVVAPTANRGSGSRFRTSWPPCGFPTGA